jgi:hypothetical protein
MSTHKAYEQPYENYWHILYPRYADPDSGAYWYGRWKTAGMCMGLFDERQQARHEWIATGPRKGREESHATAIVTHHASPVRSLTAKVCVTCLWISRNLDEEHPGITGDYQPIDTQWNDYASNAICRPSARPDGPGCWIITRHYVTASSELASGGCKAHEANVRASSTIAATSAPMSVPTITREAIADP